MLTVQVSSHCAFGVRFVPFCHTSQCKLVCNVYRTRFVAFQPCASQLVKRARRHAFCKGWTWRTPPRVGLHILRGHSSPICPMEL